MSNTSDTRDTNTANERRRFTTEECSRGHHGGCERDPNRLPSWLPVAVCQCECHDARRQVRWCRPEDADEEAR